MGIPFPEEYGGGGGDSLAYALAVEELTRVDSSVAITLCAHTSLGTQPIYLFGSEDQKQEWLPQAVQRRAPGRVRADRARGRLGRRQHPDPSRARGRRMGDQRVQAVHHQRRHRHLRRGRDHGRHRRLEQRRRPRDLEPARAQRHPRLRAGRALPQDGLERLGHAAADVRRLPRPRGEPRRRARRRAAPVLPRARHRPDRGRGDGRRPRAGRARSGARVLQGTPGVRAADLALSDDPGQARGSVDGDRGDAVCSSTRRRGRRTAGRTSR